jgi:hypothetical protein
MMNYAHFAEYVRTVEDDLVRKFGVSPDGARRIAQRLEIDAFKDYTETKDRNQLIIEYKELGPNVLAERLDVSRDTVRRRYNEAVAANKPHLCVA